MDQTYFLSNFYFEYLLITIDWSNIYKTWEINIKYVLDLLENENCYYRIKNSTFYKVLSSLKPTHDQTENSKIYKQSTLQ